MKLIYNPIKLPRVMTAKPNVARVLQCVTSLFSHKMRTSVKWFAAPPLFALRRDSLSI
jgi:hypothetical protein